MKSNFFSRDVTGRNSRQQFYGTWLMEVECRHHWTDSCDVITGKRFSWRHLQTDSCDVILVFFLLQFLDKISNLFTATTVRAAILERWSKNQCDQMWQLGIFGKPLGAFFSSFFTVGIFLGKILNKRRQLFSVSLFTVGHFFVENGAHFRSNQLVTLQKLLPKSLIILM